MVDTVIAIDEPTNLDGTSSHIFQGANTWWLAQPRQLIGNFFNGLNAQTQNQWDAQIPPNSEILAATMEFQPWNSPVGAYTTQMNSPDRAAQNFNQDALQLPFDVYRGYQRDQWSNAQVGCLSTTFTAIFGTSVTTNASWIMRQFIVAGGTIPTRAQLAQRITTRTGNMDIATLFWDGSRTGNPPGDMRVRIQGVTNDRGTDVPDGVDIAVSNPTACASVGLVQGLVSFTFPGTVTLTALTDYFILIEADYPADNANYINIYHQNAFLIAGGGHLFHYGDGRGMDWQNWPGTVDLNQGYQGSFVGPDIPWAINGTTVGVTEVSPDITALVQAQVDASNYTQDAGIIITLSRGAPSTGQRNMISNTNGADVGPILRVTYRPRDDEIGGGHGGAIIMPGDRRIEKRPDISDDQLALLAVTAIEVTEE